MYFDYQHFILLSNNTNYWLHLIAEAAKLLQIKGKVKVHQIVPLQLNSGYTGQCLLCRVECES
jgi:hypothetical protein